MPIPSTINEDIENGKSLVRSHRNMNGSATLHYTKNNQNIKIPLEPLVNKYYDFFANYMDEVDMEESDQREYRYAPKKFSKDMYGTTQFWSLILYINECHSILDFDLEKVKYIRPESIDEVLNEIFILEKIV